MRLLLAVLLTLPSVYGQTYTISTFAGGGLPIDILGTSARLGPLVPQSAAADINGNLIFPTQNSVLRLDARTGILSLIAGNGTPGFSGDTGLATGAQLNQPTGVALDSTGTIYIADTGNSRVRKVSDGVITTFAGNGSPGFGGDNGPAAGAPVRASHA